MSCGLPCRVTAVTAKPSLLPQESLRLGGRSHADCHQALAHDDVGILAVSILALPVVGVLRRFRWAAILTVIVLLECGLLAVNGGRCPLTDLASRFTVDRNPNYERNAGIIALSVFGLLRSHLCHHAHFFLAS